MRWDIKAYFQEKITEINLQDKQFLYQENETARFVFYLELGALAALKKDFRTKYFLLNFIEQGQIIGLSALHNKVYPNSVQAISQARIYQLPIEVLENQMQEDFTLRLQIVQAMCKEVSSAETKLTNSPKKTIRQRLAKLILEINKIQEDSFQAIQNDVSYTLIELAELIGIPKKNASKTISEFDSDGWIKKEGDKVKIIDKIAIEKLIRS